MVATVFVPWEKALLRWKIGVNRIKTHFPQAYEIDLQTGKGDKSKLGTISFAEIRINGKPLIVVNASQYNWRGKGKKVDYEAIRSCFEMIKKQFSGLRMAYPAIGAGLAGGDWEIISEIINKVLENENHTFVEFNG